MSAPTSSFNGDALTPKPVLVSLDEIVIIDTEDGDNLKKASIANIQTAILSDGTIVTLLGAQTLENKTLLIPIITDFTNATHNHEDAAGGGTLLSAAISDIQATIAANAAVAANTAKVTNATHTGDVTGNTILTISNAAVDIINLSATGTPDGTTFLRGDNVWAIPPGAGISSPFTWGASDEDSSLTDGILYTTEAAAAEIDLSEVVLSLKNPPTGSIITVDIRKETGVNTNVFVTIFSTLPTIDINDFTSQTAAVPAVFSDSTWEVQRRLQLRLTINDSNAAATGIKVTLA